MGVWRRDTFLKATVNSIGKRTSFAVWIGFARRFAGVTSLESVKNRGQTIQTISIYELRAVLNGVSPLVFSLFETA